MKSCELSRVDYLLNTPSLEDPLCGGGGAEPNIVAHWTALYIDAHTEMLCLLLGNDKDIVAENGTSLLLLPRIFNREEKQVGLPVSFEGFRIERKLKKGALYLSVEMFLEEIQEEEDSSPLKELATFLNEVRGFEPPQEEVIPIRSNIGFGINNVIDAYEAEYKCMLDIIGYVFCFEWRQWIGELQQSTYCNVLLPESYYIVASEAANGSYAVHIMIMNGSFRKERRSTIQDDIVGNYTFLDLESLPSLHDKVLAAALEAAINSSQNQKKKPGKENNDINFHDDFKSGFGNLDRIFSKDPFPDPLESITNDQEDVELDIEIDEPVLVVPTSSHTKQKEEIGMFEIVLQPMLYISSTSNVLHLMLQEREVTDKSYSMMTMLIQRPEEIIAKYRKAGNDASSAAGEARNKLLEQQELSCRDSM
ncbi:hypothetical protein Tco_0775746 [Tanacetum coccineum]